MIAHLVAWSVAVALLAGCGGSPLQIGAPGPMPQTQAIAAHANGGKSRMDAGVAKWDLLYVANVGGRTVNVYRYWRHNLVGVLTDAAHPFAECADTHENVYVVDNAEEKVFVYAHGGKSALRVIDDSPNEPEGCAVDPLTGNLAVANYESYPSGPGNIAVFRHARGKPLIFGPPLYRYETCAYDDKGNLLTTNGLYGNSGYGSDFAWLPKNGVKLLPITLRGGSSRYGNFNGVQSIVWDGDFFVINAFYYMATLTRVRIKNGRGHAVGTTYINGGSGYIGRIWIYNNHPGAQGTQVVATFSYSRSADEVVYWKYPAGGSPIAKITKGLGRPFGIAVSLRP